MATKTTTPRLSEADVRCVRFARSIQENFPHLPTGPRMLAELCALSRKAFSAGERSCNVPDTRDRYERAMARVEAQAAAMGLDVQWPGLWPTFTFRGTTKSVDVPA